MVILTREQADNAELKGLLEAAGLAVVEVPCVGTRLLPFEFPENGPFAAVAVTSRRAVAATADHDWSLYPGIVAAVGSATATAVAAVWRRDADILGAKGTGDALAEELDARLPRGSRVLYLRGDKTTGGLQRGLDAAGHTVVEVVVYENVAPDVPTLEGTHSGALAVFASPSAAHRFFEANDHLRSTIDNVAIGPTTARALERITGRTPAVASNPSVAALAETIMNHTGR